MKNNVDPDQMTLSEASQSGSIVFLIQDIIYQGPAGQGSIKQIFLKRIAFTTHSTIFQS